MAKRNQTGEEKGKHTLFLGPFQPDLEEVLFAWVRAGKGKDFFAPLVVLVGSNLLALYLRRMLAQRGLNHINLRFLTFIDLARTLAAEPLDREGLRPLPRYGDLVFISSLADEAEREIARNGLDRSLAVEAGAGTGKTTLLVDRILSLPKSGGLPWKKSWPSPSPKRRRAS